MRGTDLQWRDEGESNLPSRRGWTRSYFNFNSGGCNFILRPTLLILEPPPPDNYCTVPNDFRGLARSYFERALVLLDVNVGK